MSIADQITRIKNNIAASYAECSAKGATLPTTENSENLPNTIASITAGGGGGDSVEYTNITGEKITKGSKVWLNETATTTEKSNIIPESQYADTFIQTSNPNVVISGSARFTLENNQYIRASLSSNLSMTKLFIDKNGILAGSNGVYNIENNTEHTAASYECYAGNGYTAYSSQVCKINLESLAIETTYEAQDSDSEGIYTGWSFEDGYIIGSYAYRGTVRVWKLNNEGTRFNIVGGIYDNYKLTCIGQFTEQKIGWALKGADYRDLNLGAYRYSRTGDAVTVEEIPATEFPENMQSIFTEQPNYIFWNEQTLTMTATWKANNRVLIFKYENGQWVNKSPIITFEGEIGYVSCDATATKIIANYSTTTSSPVVYDGNEKSGGYYGMPYLYSNKSSITGKAEEDCENNAKSTASTVLFGGAVPPPARPAEKGYAWTPTDMIVATQFLDTHPEIYDSNKDSGATKYVAVNYSIHGKPLIYRRSNGLVYSFDGLDDNYNIIWQQQFDWGQVSNLETTSYTNSNGYEKIVAINSGDSDTNIEWTILVQTIGGEDKKSKISRGLCFVTAGLTADGVPLLCACSESTLYHFLISTDEGDTWKEISLPVSGYEYIHNVLISKGSIFVVMGTYSDIILKSSDCGDTWETVKLDDYTGDTTSRAVIQDGYNDYILFPCSDYSKGYLWNGSEFKKVEMPDIIGMPNQTDFAISAPCVYGAIISRASKGLAFVVQLEDDYGIHFKKTFDYSAVNNAGVAPIIAKDREHLCSLNYSNRRFAILDYLGRVAYTKKEIPEVGDQASTIDKQFDCTVTNYSNGVMNISIYNDRVPLMREPRGDITLG